jgi:hypothetical protein
MNTATQIQIKKARYIVNLVKSVNKDMDYALSIVCWYSMTDNEDLILSNLIKEIF